MKFGLVPHFFERRVAEGLDLEHLILETDAPYFIPNQLKTAKDEKDPSKFKYPMGLPSFVYHRSDP